MTMKSAFIAPFAIVIAMAFEPLVMTADVTATAPVLAPFEASYKVLHGRTYAGDSHMVLSRDDDGRYEYRNNVEPRGLAKWFVKGKVYGGSSFRIVDGLPRPVSYESDGPKKNDQQSITFNYDLDQAFSSYAGEQAVFDLTPGTLDMLSMDIALMMCMKAGHELSSLSVVDKNQRRTYLYAIEGPESVDTEAGKYDAIKVRRQREGSSRHYQMWLAPSLDYLPVRVEQYKDGKVSNTLVLSSYNANIQAP